MKRLFLIVTTPLLVFYLGLCVMGVRNYLAGYPPCDIHATLKDMTTCFHRDGIITYFLVLVTAVISLITLSVKHLIIKPIQASTSHKSNYRK